MCEEVSRTGGRHDSHSPGKQADVVVVLLGSDKPNLLNVAVSRAKRRLYVIGDRKAWSRQRYFETLAAHLPHATPINP